MLRASSASATRATNKSICLLVSLFLMTVLLVRSESSLAIDDDNINNGYGDSSPPTNGGPVSSPFRGYAGFIQVNETSDSNMFYWLFPSMDGNDSAPLILWLEGGPGIPCAFSIFAGPGPYRLEYEMPYNFSSPIKMTNNSYTWNQHYHMLFVDNPIGVGFSYTSSNDGYPTDEKEVAEDLYAFLKKFFKVYAQYSSNDFYVMGESYGGKYVPALAHKLQNEGNQSEIWNNLKGIAVGDGLFDPAAQASTWSSFGVNVGIVDSPSADRWNEETVKPLVGLIKNGSYAQASFEYYTTIMDFAQSYNASMYNYLQYGTQISSTWFSSFIEGAAFVNTTASRQALNVYPLSMPIYEANPNFFAAFYSDVPKSITSYIPALLEAKPVLLYNGQLDWFLNVPGQLKWLQSIEWSGQSGFNQSIPRGLVKGDIPGYPLSILAAWVRSYQGLSFAVIPGSGHFANLDAPLNLYALVSDWISSLSN